jgi:hypothetical protein
MSIEQIEREIQRLPASDVIRLAEWFMVSWLPKLLPVPPPKPTGRKRRSSLRNWNDVWLDLPPTLPRPFPSSRTNPARRLQCLAVLTTVGIHEPLLRQHNPRVNN